MASYTGKLNLYEIDPSTDSQDTFNIDTMLNENWDKIDANAIVNTAGIPEIIKGNLADRPASAEHKTLFIAQDKGEIYQYLTDKWVRISGTQAYQLSYNNRDSSLSAGTIKGAIDELDNKKIDRSGDTITGQLTTQDTFTVDDGVGITRINGAGLSTVRGSMYINNMTETDGVIYIRPNAYNGSNASQGQLKLTPTGASIAGDLYANNVKVDNNDVWHEGNMGENSGLNADMIDGLHLSDLDNRFLSITGDSLLAINRDSNRIGIGTTTPEKLLHIVGGNTHAMKLENNGNYWDIISKVADGTIDETAWGFGAVGTTAATNKFSIGTMHDNTSNTIAKFVIQRDGNVGIGTETPSVRLDVAGQINSNGNRVLTIDDTGTGNNLDADTVDGIHGDQLFHYRGGVTGDLPTLNNTTKTGNYIVSYGGHSEHLIVFGDIGGSTPTVQLKANYDDELYFRCARDGSNEFDGLGFYKIWHEGNMGADSGLNADLLDGLHASQFLRSDTADIMNDNLSFGADAKIIQKNEFGMKWELAEGNDYVELNETNNSWDFVRAGGGVDKFRFVDSGTELLRISNSEFRYKGYDILTSWHEGHGRGTDADTVDGLHASQFLRSDIDDTMTGQYTLTHKDYPTTSSVSEGAIRFVSDNNLMQMGLKEDINARTGYIQVRHASLGYSTVYGSLELNPLGGNVNVNGKQVATVDDLGGYLSSSAISDMVEFSDYSQTLANTGYVKLPNGLYIQWGLVEGSEDSWATHNFPTAFPNACLQIVGSMHNGGANNGSQNCYAREVSNTQYKVMSNNWVSEISWIAIGY